MAECPSLAASFPAHPASRSHLTALHSISPAQESTSQTKTVGTGENSPIFYILFKLKTAGRSLRILHMLISPSLLAPTQFPSGPGIPVWGSLSHDPAYPTEAREKWLQLPGARWFGGGLAWVWVGPQGTWSSVGVGPRQMRDVSRHLLRN